MINKLGFIFSGREKRRLALLLFIIIIGSFLELMGVTIFGACCYILLNLLADLIIALDPRVRL